MQMKINNITQIKNNKNKMTIMENKRVKSKK